MGLFQVAELMKVGVEDEKSGIAFYSILAKKTKDEWMKKLWDGLAAQEASHLVRYRKMLDALGPYNAEETYPGEYMTYLRAMLDSRAFKSPEEARKAAEQTTGDLDAIHLAIRFERDTLVLMNELRELAPESEHDIIEQLTMEERGHLVELHAALQKMEAKA